MTETVRLRPATLEDAQRLFAWRNDPQTRAQSLQQLPVAWESHLTWLQASLRNPNRQLYIAEGIVQDASGQPLILGTVRADKLDEEYELSWTVAPEQRGKGWGRKLVAALIEILPAQASYTAIVLYSNPASQRIAESLGLMERQRLEGHTVYAGRKPAP